MNSEPGTMTVEKGYKVTEVGVIPEEWEVVTVKDLLLSLEAGVSVNSENRAASSSEKGILKTSSTTSNRFLPTENKVILENEISRARVSPVADSLIISRMNTPDLVGAAGYVAENYPNLFLPDRLWLAKVRSRACARWFFSVLCSNKMKEQIRNAATGTSGSMKNLSRNAFSGLELPLPPLPEQEKIAEVLSTVDEHIGETEDLIEKTEILKKGVMQRLLTQGIGHTEFKDTQLGRIPAEWEVVNLESVVSQVSRPTPRPSEPYYSIGIRSHGKGTFKKYVELPENVKMDTLYIVRADDLIVNITFAWEHAIAVVRKRHDGLLASHRFPTYEIRKTAISIGYLKYIILEEKFRRALELISPGGAGRNRVLNKKDFLKVQIKLPPLPEQREIAEILTAIDDRTGEYRAKLEALTRLKSGLMQQLLTGRIRVKF